MSRVWPRARRDIAILVLAALSLVASQSIQILLETRHQRELRSERLLGAALA